MQKQYGAIPFIRGDEGLKVVLVTSAAGYWIFPKGQYEKEHGKQGTAELEALEEAGVEGKLLKKRAYRTKVVIKSGERVRLTLYALDVRSIRKKWKEDYRRKRVVVSVSKAFKLIDSSALRECLRDFSSEFER
ncbi:NUDIX hydrolase [Pontiella sp.]|uniref:NUDIX hydrolase n=1 Tax=Pontiella sp. TaxID=2837462 RepID=UPI00356B45C6